VTILLTRPRGDSEAFAAKLAACGVSCVIAPLMTIEPLPMASVDPGEFQAVLVTSANGARCLTRLPDLCRLPVFAVGPATAAEAREARVVDVRCAQGDVVALADLVIRDLDPRAGPLLHLAGTVTAGDLAGALGCAGFTVERLQAYRAVTAEALPEEAAAALRDGDLQGAAFFSPRTATTFVRLTEKAGLAGTVTRVRAFCLSSAVSESLDPLAWAERHVAERPDGASLAHLICATLEMV